MNLPSPAHTIPAADVLAALGTGPDGLDPAEAERRLRSVGPNELRAAAPRPAWRIALDQLRSVVVLLLAVAAVLSALLGDAVDAAAIAAVLVINALIGFVMELRARRSMEALLRLEAPSADVIRGGHAETIPAREVVPGDLLVLEPGQAVPADARIVESFELQTAEAALTGESLPEAKDPGVLPVATPLADRRNMVYLGTTIVDGAGRAVVVATGMATELGRIGGMLAELPEERTPFERRLDALGRRLAGVAIATAAVIASLSALQGMPLRDVVTVGLALAVAAIPEGLPAVSTIALAVGVRRMARRNALVRRLPAVETLGSVTVVCADKTGTLTTGEVTVTTLRTPSREITVTGVGIDPTGEFRADGAPLRPLDDPETRALLTTAVLANRAELRRNDTGWSIHGDPTEAALLVAARKAGLDRDELLRASPPAGEVPFSSRRMLMASFHRESGRLVAHAKGAPARIIERCDRIGPDGTPLDATRREALLLANRELAARGMRVLAFASGPVSSADEAALHGLAFLGLAGMMDPAAPGVKETIRSLHEAGIRTIMLTGDQRLTAEAVARDLDMLDDLTVLDGREVAGASDDELLDQVSRAAAFSRLSPEDKLRIVGALQRRGEILAMLGDGVNDAAALRKADVGVAMGRRGTDAAKSAAEVVLEDDRFTTVAAAVEEGRVIFDNIRKVVFYLFSCNLAEILVLLAAGLASLPLPLLPLQILWLNLVTDTFPALSLAVEPGDPDVMRRPPRDPHEAMLSMPFMRTIAGHALLVAAPTLAAFAYGLRTEGDGAGPTTLAFMTLALAQTLHLGNARSREPVLTPARAMANPAAAGAVALVVGLQLLAVYWAPLAGVLGTRPIAGREWAIVIALAAVPALVGQAVRIARSARRRVGTPSTA